MVEERVPQVAVGLFHRGHHLREQITFPRSGRRDWRLVLFDGLDGKAHLQRQRGQQLDQVRIELRAITASINGQHPAETLRQGATERTYGCADRVAYVLLSEACAAVESSHLDGAEQGLLRHAHAVQELHRGVRTHHRPVQSRGSFVRVRQPTDGRCRVMEGHQCDIRTCLPTNHGSDMRVNGTWIAPILQQTVQELLQEHGSPCEKWMFLRVMVQTRP
ncbi:MAG: hypothetical protein DYH17_10980 [Xanthomonadales bacterium PRO6]|nr:hypothetical protein [Xanthomonadales bacterium PRO6]